MTTSTQVDLVEFRTNTVGTGSPLSIGAATDGHRGSEALTDGATYSYSIASRGGYEVGRGVYSQSGQTITRGTLLSSNNNNPIAIVSGATISIVLLAEDLNGLVGGPPGFTVGTVTNGSAPSVTITGISPNFVLNFVLERGPQGIQGQAGDITPEFIALAAMVNSSAASAVISANSAVVAAATVDVYPSSASSNVPRGAVLNVLTPGANGTNGRDYTATYTGGNYLANPTILYDVLGGAVENVRLVDRGVQIGASPVEPTVVFGSGSGGAGLTLTSSFRVGSLGYWVQSSDGNTIDHYKNVGGVATSDSANVKSIPTSAYVAAAIANFNAASAAAASAPTLLNAIGMGYQRTVPPSDLSNGYGAPTTASNGQVTYAGGGAIQGSLYYLSGSELDRRDAGGHLTVRVPIISGTPASARLIQYNLAGAEVGSRPAPVITTGEIGFHGIVLNSATVLLRQEITSGGSALVASFMAVSMGEPATVTADALYAEAGGYYVEQLNETAFVPLTYTLSQQGTDATFIGGVLTQSANSGASAGLGINSATWAVGGKCRIRFRCNSRLLRSSIGTAYTGDANGFSWPALAAKVTEIPGDTAHFFYDLAFYIPAHPTSPSFPLRGMTLGFYAPVEGAISDDIVASASFQLPPVRTPPLAVRTYISNAIATALAAGGTTLQVPTSAIDLWGDSLIDFNHAAGAVSDALSTLLGGAIPVQNLGVATQNTIEIAQRAGGNPVLISLVGDAIPATTTAVAISNYNAYSCPITSASNSTNGTDPLAGTLGGIAGVLTSVRSSGVITGLTFTRNVAGSVVPINRNTPFLTTQGEATRSKYQVMVWGKNDVGGIGGTGTGNMIADAYDRQVRAMLPVDKRFLVGSVLHGNHDAGTDVINDINIAIGLRYSRYMIDLTSAPTAEEMATIGFTPTADDLTDMDAVVVATAAGTALTINSVTSGTVAQYKYLDIQTFRGNFTIMSGSGSSWTLNGAPGNFAGQTITLKGFIPRGMRSGGYSGGAGVLGGDQLHLNAIGNQLWALRLYRAFKQRAWF